MLAQLIRGILANKAKIITGIVIILLTFVSVYFGLNKPNIGNSDVVMGASGSDVAKWVLFEKFSGYNTKSDPQKIDPGANPVGQNTYINDGDRISTRDFGYEIFPAGIDENVSGTPVTSLYTFRLRNGTNIMLRSYDTKLEYYSDKIGQWEQLKDGFTANQKFGFADHNTNLDQTSYVYFCNAVENYQRWTGNIAELTSNVVAGTTTLNVDTTTLWPSTGTTTYCGVTVAYTSKTTTTLAIASSTIDCASGRGVAQAPQEYPAAPKGNILMVMNTRMFVSGVASSTQALFYSKIADATDFTFTSPRTAGDGGIINMPEGGGGITGLAQDEGALYAFKRNMIKSVIFSTDENDLPTIKPVKPYDNKSQTVGAVSSKAIFAGGNGIFFITPNNEIMHLARLEYIDYPQVKPISDSIKPTVDTIDFSNASGIYWKNKAYFSVKQNSNSVQNDVILVYDTTRDSWESPIIGINVNDWTISKFAELEDLYFGSSFSLDVYKINNQPLDNGYGFSANWRSREETFGLPWSQKTADNFYIEGYIDDNTQITVSVLLDEDGFTQKYSKTYTGNESNNKFRYNSIAYNLFGFNPFGYERFGSNPDFTTKKKFRMYIPLRRVPFYSAQVEIASDGESQKWEVLQYAFHVQPETQEMKTSLINSL